MENLEYYHPVRVLLGNGELGRLGEVVTPLAGRVLLVYGEAHIKKTGVYGRVTALLRDAGVEWVDLGGIHPNPRVADVRRGVQLCRDHDLQLVLAVGGGSCSDSAKAIAAGVRCDFDIWEAFADFHRRIPPEEKRTPRESLPVVVVMTKAGTGSEFDLTSVLTNQETHEKLILMHPCLFPVCAICDPELTYSLPADQTAAGVADMMTHYFEQYFSPTADAHALDRFKEAMLQTAIENGPRALAAPRDSAARKNLVFCSTWSCSSLNITGVVPEWSTHFIEHEVTALTDLNHGVGMAILYPAWMSYVLEASPGKFAQYGRRVWGLNTAAPDTEVGRLAIDRTREFWRSLGLPSRLSEVGVTEELFDTIAARATRFGPLGTVRTLETDDVRAILESVR